MQIIDDNKAKDRFLVAMLIAKRAKVLVEGEPPLTKVAETNKVSQAVKEYDLGYIKVRNSSEN